MKKALYAVLAVVVIFAVVVFGVKFKEKTSKDNIKAATQAEVERQLKLIEAQRPGIFKGARGKMAWESYKKVLAQQARLKILIEQEVEKRNIAVAAGEVDAAVTQARQAYGSEKKFTDALKKQGLTLEVYKAGVKEQIAQSKLVNLITKDVKVAAAEVKAYYDANKAAFDNKPFGQIADLVKTRLVQQKQQAEMSRFYEGLTKENK
ncbi:MAG: hypothetical protein Q8L35_03535 [Actinomycetota bacterium]|nr:hypothetical protein [Actinomycetota bacterium]